MRPALSVGLSLESGDDEGKAELANPKVARLLKPWPLRREEVECGVAKLPVGTGSTLTEIPRPAPRPSPNNGRGHQSKDRFMRGLSSLLPRALRAALPLEPRESSSLVSLSSSRSV